MDRPTPAPRRTRASRSSAEPARRVTKSCCLPRRLHHHGRDLFAESQAHSGQQRRARTSRSAKKRRWSSPRSTRSSSVDPPFDNAYLHLTHQLELLRGRTLVLNDPRGIREANEKLFAFHFAEFIPRSLVTSSPQGIVAFVNEVGGKSEY